MIRISMNVKSRGTIKSSFSPKGRIDELKNLRYKTLYIANYESVSCWFHGSSFKGFSIVFLALRLAKVELSLKSNGMWFFRHFFAPYLFHRSRNNWRDKLRSSFGSKKMSRKPHLKLLR